MNTPRQTVSEPRIVAAADLGAKIVALAGIGLIGYGILFLINNFTGLIELGLTSDQVGVTRDQIAFFNPHLYDYISHLQVAAAGLIIALGVGVVALAWFGIRTGQLWALWTALTLPIIALVIGVPLHYPYGFGTLGHLGPIYLDVIILVVGTVLAYRALKS